jgi:hypothetical protein
MFQQTMLLITVVAALGIITSHVTSTTVYFSGFDWRLQKEVRNAKRIRAICVTVFIIAITLLCLSY